MQGDNLVTLSFTTTECRPVDVGDYIEWQGARYTAMERTVAHRALECGVEICAAPLWHGEPCEAISHAFPIGRPNDFVKPCAEPNLFELCHGEKSTAEGEVKVGAHTERSGFLGLGRKKVDDYGSILDKYPQLIDEAGKFDRQFAEKVLAEAQRWR